MFKKGMIVGFGMSAGSIILLIATPWLSRAYSPQEFGSLAIFIAVMAVISSTSCLRHDAAILVVEDSKVDATVQLALMYVIFFSIIGGLGVSLIAPILLGSNYDVLIENLSQLLIGAIGGGALLIACALSMRREEYGINALIRAVQGPVYVMMALFFTTGLLNGWALAWLIAGITSVIYLALNVQLSKLSVVKKQAISLKEYSLRLTPTFLLDSVALSFPIFFINLNYSAEELGNFFQVNRLLAGPLLLISAIIGQLMLEKSGKYFRQNISSLNIFKVSILILLGISALAFLMVVFAGHYLLELILGVGWRTDTAYLLLILIPILCKTIVSPITCVFLTHNQSRYVVNWQIIYFFATLLVLLFASFLKVPLEIFLGIYAITEMVIYSLYLYWAYKVVKIEPSENIKSIYHEARPQ